MSDHRCGVGAPMRPASAHAPAGAQPGMRGALGVLLLAGVAGCTSSPAYPIRMGERPGDGSVMAVQPQYPISARDAAQNAADRAAQNGGAQNGYPAYGAAPVAPPQGSAYAPAPGAAPPPADDPAEDAPHPIPNSSVDSSDLPPPAAAPPVPPADAPPPSAAPHTISFGGGQIVFGTDSAEPQPLEFAAYRHHRHAAPAEAASSDDATDTAAATPASRHRRHKAAPDTAAAEAPAPAAAATDTPYQTVVRPGEKLDDVAERVHSSRAALTALNTLKHPRHVKPGTVLKIPYRYSYEVQKGDTLYTISHRFNQDPDAVAKLNALKHAAALQPGQTIDLPPSAEDTGKRDHATASGPSPVAAPEKLADAALRKTERHGRRHRADPAAAPAAEPATETAAAEPAPSRRGRHARGDHAPAPLAVAAAAPPPVAPAVEPSQPSEPREAQAAPAPPPRRSPPPTPAVQTAQGEATPSAPTSYAGVRPTPPPPAASGVVAGYGYRAAPALTASAGNLPAVSTSAAGAPTATTTPARSYRTASAPAASTPAYRAAAPTPSTYVSPGYVQPGSAGSGYAVRATPAASDARVASVTPPRYAPSGTGGFEPSLGRERPSAPALAAGPLSATEIASAGRGRFIWPMRGQLISGFGDKGTGQHNDGMDIAAIPGTGVRAAAAGEVVYAGSSIPGFGNLVLVKHSGGWVTAYAHLDRIEVRMREAVSQGEEIGQAGQTGAVDRPQLHFEVRYAPDPADKARPVDPTLVLPAG